MIDLHQDLLPYVRAGAKIPGVRQTSWEQLETSGVRLVVASTWPGFVAPDIMSPRALHAIEGYMQHYREFAAQRVEWRLVLEPKDLEAVLPREGPRGLMVHVEGIGHLDDSVEHVLQRWYELGCRSVGIVWNRPNGLASGPYHPHDGLTERGRRAMRWLDREPVMLDLAHMGEQSFWDALECSSGPVVVSHACCRALCDHPRNLRDEQLRSVASRHGVVGVAFSSRFLCPTDAAGVARAADHVEHLIEVMGEDHVAIGSDFGGLSAEELVADLTSVAMIDKLVDEIRRRGASEAQLDALAWGNAARVLRVTLEKHGGDI